MMTNQDFPRSQWLRLWTALPADQLRTVAAALSSRYEIDDLELPQSGLGLLVFGPGLTSSGSGRSSGSFSSGSRSGDDGFFFLAASGNGQGNQSSNEERVLHCLFPIN